MSRIYQPTLLTEMLGAVYWFDDAVRQTQEALGMQSWSRAQGFLIINVLLGEGRATRLAKRLGVSRQAVGRLIGELVQAGVLVTEPDPDDSRALRVRISEKSAEAGNATIAVVRAMEQYLSDRFGAEQLQALHGVLRMDWGPPPVLSAAAVEAANAQPPRPRPKAPAQP